MSLITINLTITASPNSPRIPLKVEEKTTPSDLRKNVATATSIPLPNLRLIFRGRMIKDDDSITDVIEEYKLENESVLHCMGKPEKKEEAAPAAPTSPVAAPAAGSTVSINPSAATTATTPTASSNLQQALTTLRSSNSPSAYLTAVTTLQKILTNIISHPLEEKYRSIKKSNASFHKRLGGVHGGGDAIMQACGFEIVNTDQGETSYSLQATPSAWNQLLETKKQVDAAVVEAQMMQNSGVAAPAAAAAPMMPPAGAAPMPGFGASMPPMPPGGLTPDMQRAAAEMMSNPAAMQQMLQNPSMRQMLESDPRFANNPMLRQSLDALSSNPQMLQQMSQMMQDPNMQARMQAAMGGGAGGGGGMPGAGMGGGGMPSAGNPGTNNNNNNANSSEGNDQELTEEEMLEEAIRRSLQDS